MINGKQSIQQSIGSIYTTSIVHRDLLQDNRQYINGID
jgi:hypothetical protein